MSLKTIGKLALGAYSVHQGIRLLGEATSVLVGGSGLGKMHTVGPPPEPVSDERTGGMRRKVFQVAPADIDGRIAILQEKIQKGRQDPVIRELAVKTVSRRCGDKWCVTEGDQWAEVVAIYDELKTRYRYVHDEARRDLFQSPRRTLQLGGGDCLPQGTLLLNDKFELVPIEKLIIGSRIWGHDRWSEVKDVWWKGILPVDVVFMNNGSSFKATADHKVYVALCPSHPVRWSTPGTANFGRSCSCPMEVRAIESITVAQLEEGMVMLQPERIQFGAEEVDPRRSYVEGLYLSDGSLRADAAFTIAGLDGGPKEAQKREVEQICRELNVATTWQRTRIDIRDKGWALRAQQMGHRARFKHALSINLTETAARELLRGIMADSGANTHGAGRTFTTTSRELFLQTRILFRMQGVSCGERYIVNHGGLGEHPIWRLQTRPQGDKMIKLLRVKAVERGVVELPVYDLTTDDHKVYLPEADVTVRNCDDAVILLNSCLGSIGYGTGARVVETRESTGGWDHIYSLAMINGKWVALDMSVPGWPAGREVPRSQLRAIRDYAFG